MTKKNKDTNIPHNRWVYIATHTSGGKYLYVSKSPITMADILKSQNMDTIKSISVVDVQMVVIIE